MKYTLLLLTFLGWAASLVAQQYDELENHLRTADTTVYYVQMNSALGDFKQIAYHGGKIGVVYEDRFGSKDSVRIAMTNRSDGSTSSYIFSKRFGTNEFLLEQVDLSGLTEPAVFNLSLVDDMGKKHEKNLLIDPEKLAFPMAASIIKSPIKIDCKTPSNTLIEFFSEIRGGKAPFLIEWRFAGNEQEFKELIPIQGYSSGLIADLPPPYRIEMKVTDSCGEIDYEIVTVACDESLPNYNTILFNVDPLRKRTIEKL